MKVNTKIRYGLRTMIEIASQSDNTGILQKDISKNQNISEKYLDHIISALKTNGLIVNVSGKKSGYILKKPQNKISIYDIYKSFEPELSIVHCVSNPELCEKSGCCSVREFWNDLNDINIKFLKKHSLESLVKKNKKSISSLKK